MLFDDFHSMLLQDLFLHLEKFVNVSMGKNILIVMAPFSSCQQTTSSYAMSVFFIGDTERKTVLKRKQT